MQSVSNIPWEYGNPNDNEVPAVEDVMILREKQLADAAENNAYTYACEHG